MDHHQQQQLPLHQSETDSKVATATPLPTPAAAPAKPAPLGHLEEFVLGCLSGLAGSCLAWLCLSGLEFLFYIILLPALALELWEAYVLFRRASSYKFQTKQTSYSEYHLKVVARKRLIRQLFGQGVIMGSAGLTVTQPDFDWSNTSEVTFYAAAWLAWIVICHILHSLPAQDKVAVQIKKQHLELRNSRKLKLRRSSSTSSHRSGCSHSTGSSNRRSMRRSRSRPPLVSINLP